MSTKVDGKILQLQTLIDPDYMPLDSLEMSIGIIEKLQKLQFSKIIKLCANNESTKKQKERAWGKLNKKCPEFKKALVRLFMESVCDDEYPLKATVNYVSNLKNFHLKTIQGIPKLIEEMKNKFTFEMIEASV